MRATTRFIGLFVLAAFGGCGGDVQSPAGNSATPEAAAPNAARARTGVIEIDSETWTIVPSIQCSVYPGPVVSIAGHAAEDEAIEIVIDYAVQRSPVGVSVEKSGGPPSWSAGRDALSFEIDGNHVKGEGTFSESLGGKQAEGRFEIAC
jgi:hypothetical protein